LTVPGVVRGMCVIERKSGLSVLVAGEGIAVLEFGLGTATDLERLG
jgi:hypothetical protein